MKNSEENVPNHIAIIMDGNRRWAKKNGLSVVAGHDYVAEKLIEPLVDRCIEHGISYITFWAFSTENWQRRKTEVKGMMRIFRKGLRRDAKRLFEKGVRIRILGDIGRFPEDIAKQARDWVEKSKKNTTITASFALNYGGRDEILRAISKMITDHRSQITDLQPDEDLFGNYLDTAGMPDPDLIIRTGGEQRLSGFMSWQSAYSELYFTETFMPDFNVGELDKALISYTQRVRRFGE